MVPVLDVVLHVLVAVCLALEGDAAVCPARGGVLPAVLALPATLALEQASQPLIAVHQDVEEVEADDGKLLLLLPVDFLMLDVLKR